ncbi:MAG: TRAP transporter small permease subunit [Pseudomonadota bacterium]
MIRTRLDAICGAWSLLGGAVLLAIVAVTAANAGAFGLDKLARLGGGTVSGLPGYEDFVRLAMGSAAPMFLPYCQCRRGHLAVDFFADYLPRPLQQAIDKLSLILIAALAAFLAWQMTLGMLETRADNALSRVLGWAEWPFYLTGVASMALWAAVALAQLLWPEPRTESPANG